MANYNDIYKNIGMNMPAMPQQGGANPFAALGAMGGNMGMPPSMMGGMGMPPMGMSPMGMPQMGMPRIGMPQMARPGQGMMGVRPMIDGRPMVSGGHSNSRYSQDYLDMQNRMTANPLQASTSDILGLLGRANGPSRMVDFDRRLPQGGGKAPIVDVDRRQIPPTRGPSRIM